MGKLQNEWAAWAVRFVIVSGILYLTWLNTDKLSKETDKIQWQAHERWSSQVLSHLKEDITDIKQSIIRIESKLEKRGLGYILDFPMYPSNYFSSTNLGGGSIYGRRN